MKKIILFLLFFGFEAFADEGASEVREFVDVFGNKVINIASNKNLSEESRKQKIIDEIDLVIDSSWISRFVLGKNYRKFNKEQKARFKDLYREFMINTYGPKFKNYNGRKFSVLKVDKQRIFYVARCEFLPRDSEVAISVDFRVRKKKKTNKLVVLDFVAEGVSLIEAQRSEYNSVISQKGIAKFLDDFAQKIVRLKNKA